MLVVLMKWEAKSTFFASEPMLMFCNSRYPLPLMNTAGLGHSVSAGLVHSEICECSWCLMYCCYVEVSGVWCHWLAPVWPGLPDGVLCTPQCCHWLWGALSQRESPFHRYTLVTSSVGLSTVLDLFYHIIYTLRLGFRGKTIKEIRCIVGLFYLASRTFLSKTFCTLGPAHLLSLDHFWGGSNFVPIHWVHHSE